MADFRIARAWSESEQELRRSFLEVFRRAPIPDDELLAQLGLFLNRQTLSRILFLNEVYRRVVGVPGVVFELGVRWGQNLAVWSSLRGIYEPYNHARRIVGFDTFGGFPAVHEQDGDAEAASVGAYGVADDYAEYLTEVLRYHEHESPLSHLERFELVQGDAAETVPSYLAEHPETMIALAYFDFDLYEPTRAALEALQPHLTQGTVLAFDQLGSRTFPGETRAVQEVLGLDSLELIRSPYAAQACYAVVGGRSSSTRP
jgi:Macrocin-O-methyltransferase (TylF)